MLHRRSVNGPPSDREIQLVPSGAKLHELVPPVASCRLEQLTPQVSLEGLMDSRAVRVSAGDHVERRFQLPVHESLVALVIVDGWQVRTAPRDQTLDVTKPDRR